jgi:UDP-N-acetylglucosamine--N-acetylmuramyl-(pentapeptide) pyrophosphoryl-undecaprenol N-acetylglucosamine transferase
MKTLLIAGGSGGHLIPALTLAEHLQVKGSCMILSTSRPVDRTLAADSHVEWITVDLQKFTPVWRWLMPGYLFHQLGAMRRVWNVLREARPDAVVGFGGYLSAVGVVAARLSGVPAVVHEQNLIPGKANRLLARVADAVGVSFEETKIHLPSRARIEVTGNPLRTVVPRVSAAEARSALGLDPSTPVLLVMGGSQGSEAINNLALGMCERMPDEIRARLQLLHLAGEKRREEVERAYELLGVQARVFGFCRDMGSVYAAASLAISRAGATTISEMRSLQVPSVLIPYPYAGAHQLANARWLEARGGAAVLEEAGLTPQILWNEVSKLIGSPERLARMKAALAANADGHAVDRLEALVEKVAG